MDVLDEIRRQLGDRGLEGLARQIGAGRGETERAVGAALPTLVGALARNAGRPDGARSLARALDRDHDPSLLDQLGDVLGGGEGAGGGGLAAGLGSLLGGGGGARGGGLGGFADLAGAILGDGGSKALDGAGILRHVLGDRRRAVEGGVGRASGLDGEQVGRLLMLLAPLVMSALAKVKQKRHLDERGLAEALAEERREIEDKAPGVQSGGLADLLDRDGDGQIGDDLADIGGSLAKAFFRR